MYDLAYPPSHGTEIHVRVLLDDLPLSFVLFVVVVVVVVVLVATAVGMVIAFVIIIAIFADK